MEGSSPARYCSRRSCSGLGFWAREATGRAPACSWWRRASNGGSQGSRGGLERRRRRAGRKQNDVEVGGRLACTAWAKLARVRKLGREGTKRAHWSIKTGSGATSRLTTAAAELCVHG